MSWDYKTYYEKNKAKINAKRRRKYRTDSQYRKKVLARSRKYQKTKKTEQLPPGVVRGEGGRLYGTVGRAAMMMGLSPNTIRSYERRGVLPPASHYDDRGYRLYTVAQLTLLKVEYRRWRRLKVKSLESFTERVFERWEGFEHAEEGTGT